MEILKPGFVLAVLTVAASGCSCSELLRSRQPLDRWLLESALPPGESPVGEGVMMASLATIGTPDLLVDVSLEFEAGIGARLFRRKIATCKSVGRGDALSQKGYVEVVSCDSTDFGLRVSDFAVEAVDLTTGKVVVGLARPPGLEVKLGSYASRMGWLELRPGY